MYVQYNTYFREVYVSFIRSFFLDIDGGQLGPKASLCWLIIFCTDFGRRLKEHAFLGARFLWGNRLCRMFALIKHSRFVRSFICSKVCILGILFLDSSSYPVPACCDILLSWILVSCFFSLLLVWLWWFFWCILSSPGHPNGSRNCLEPCWIPGKYLGIIKSTRQDEISKIFLIMSGPRTHKQNFGC